MLFLRLLARFAFNFMSLSFPFVLNSCSLSMMKVLPKNLTCQSVSMLLLPVFLVCGGTFTKMAGSMRSPDYPEDYPESVTCQWVIKLPVQYKVRLEFTDFLLENSESCRFDFVLVMDGLPSSPTPVGKFCGNGSKDDVESKSNFLTVLFKSDSSMTKKGFEAYWSAIPVDFTEKPTSVSASSKVPSNEITTSSPREFDLNFYK